MARMVDADALIEKFEKLKCGDVLINIFVSDVISEIKNQPTAYDVEKVVEELENEKYTREERFKYDTRMQEKMVSYNKGLNKSIGIVRKGGV